MKNILSMLIISLIAFSTYAQREVLFNDGWTFSLESFNEIQNISITIPHDWSVTLPTSKYAPMGNDGGYFIAGKGEYTKIFQTDDSWLNKHNYILFEGVYMNARVNLNGHDISSHSYGWTPFEVCIDEYLKYDSENVLKVFVDNSKQKNCRWYTGSGIYRNVWLKHLPKNDAITDFSVHYAKSNDFYTLMVDCRTKVNASVLSHDGIVIAEGELPLKVEKPQEWSPDSPYLYTLVLKSKTDNVATKIGFRTIEYSADSGLLLNGKSIKLSGACIHHDNGPLGACAYKDAEYRRVKLLKSAGFNAVRTSHNPPSSAFLDACDSLGLLVIDEIFDGWRRSKNTYDYSTLFDDCWQDDIDSWVKRDINHPSIFCWSIGNEVIERTENECIMTARKLIGRVHSIDPYRPVTSAMCSWEQGWACFDPLMAEHDICGYNYYLHEAPNDHQRVPSRIIVQTESYPRDAIKNYHLVMDNNCVIGDFVWTGIDYLGESGIGRYYYEGETPGEHWQADHFPWHGAYCGDIDLIGWRKPISYLREMLYNKDNNNVHIGVKEPDGFNGKIKETLWSVWPTWERWTWNGWEGKPIDIEVYSNAEAIRLFLNDKLIGEEKVSDCTAKFSIAYNPGTLRAVAIRNGEVIGSKEIRTADKAHHIELKVEYGEELTFVTATIVDKNDTPVFDNIELTCDSDSDIRATASADLTDQSPYIAKKRMTWNGMAQAIIRTKQGATVNVSGKGLKSVSKVIKKEYNTNDIERITSLLSEAKKLKSDTNWMIYFGRKFLNIHYVGHTLEINDIEQLVVNTTQLDCTTFVETVTALSLCAKHNQWGFSDYTKYLQQIRYANGNIHYTSRNHYFLGWINENSDIVSTITTKGEYFIKLPTKSLNYMSKHIDSYRMLSAHKEWLPNIISMETSVSKLRYDYIPKERIDSGKELRDIIHDGDILALTTDIEGLDTQHIGIAIWREDGLHLLNASSLHKKVVEEEQLLHDYLQTHKKMTGVVVARMK